MDAEMVPERGLEPPWCCHRQLLKLVRLPFRHSGKAGEYRLSALLLACSLYRAYAGIVRWWREEGFDAFSFFFENAGFFVFAVVARVVAVSFLFLIKVKTHFEVFAAKLCVRMKARIACRSKRSDEARLTVFLALKGVAGAPEEIDGIVGDVFDGEFHCRGTGNRTQST